MTIEFEVNCFDKEELEVFKDIFACSHIKPSDSILVKHDESTEERKLDALDVFVSDFCGINPSDNEDEWVFDALASCRMEHTFILQLKALFALFPEFFELVKTAKDTVCGENVCRNIFLPFENKGGETNG